MRSPEEVVRAFFREVRSGYDPNQAFELMASSVKAHQLTSENLVKLERSPQDYAEHVREMQSAFGQFEVEITEFLVQGDRVYVRWTQVGKHIGIYEGFQPTGLPITQITSAVYRIADGKIVEYWIQIDRAGLYTQFELNLQNLSSEQNTTER